MARLKSMPQLELSKETLAEFGKVWTANKGCLSRTPPRSSMELTCYFDQKVAEAFAAMLGDICISRPTASNLAPSQPDCVEVGNIRIIGGVRPQNFDVGYRPDGTRIAFDSKTLNDFKSVQKNYQNMINDLGTEATTVHIRFPYAVVGFLVAIPQPCLSSPQKEAITYTLERLSGRSSPLDSAHRAEAITLVIWDPNTGEVNKEWPAACSSLRIERFSSQMEQAYVSRYKGLPPHHD